MKVVAIVVLGVLAFIPMFVVTCVVAALLAKQLGAEVDGQQLAVAAMGGLFTAIATAAVVLVKGGA